MEKSYKLSDFKFPGISGLEHNASYFGFGEDTDTALTYDQLADDLAMGFAKQEAVEIDQDIEITELEYDIKFLINAGYTLTLPTEDIKVGRSVTIVPRFINGTSEDATEEAFVTDGTNSWIIEEHTDLNLIWNGYSWKEQNYTLRDKINLVISSCYTGRDLRKVLFDLGDISADHYENITFAEVMKALHNRCQNNNFSGLGIGDWVDHDTITVATYSVTDPGNSNTYTYGYNTSGYIGSSGSAFTLTRDDNYHNTRIRIAGFDTYYNIGSAANTSHHILFEYENCPFRGVINPSNYNYKGFEDSCLYQWLNNSYYNALNTAIGGYIMTTNKYYEYNNSTSSYSSASGYIESKIFLPTEREVYGHASHSYNGTDSYGTSTPQWPIYNLRPEKRVKLYNGSRCGYWLSSCCCSHIYGFVDVSDSGASNCYDAADSAGVSCVFCIW